jgi:hypothetical protein
VEEEVKPAPVVEIVAPLRAPDGKFVKGNKIRPANYNGGRPRKLDSRPILEAIHDEFTVEEIRAMLRKAYATAVQMEDWKGQMAVVQFVAYYAIGKPVSRSIKANIEVEDFIKLFKEGGDGVSDEAIQYDESGEDTSG